MNSTYSSYARRHESVEVSIYSSPSMILSLVIQRFVSSFSEKLRAAAKEQAGFFH